MSAPNIITSKSNNPFRHDVGDVAGIVPFANNFMGRYPSDPQKETLRAFGGDGDGDGEWNLRYHEILLEIGMKGGKNWIAEIIAAYTPYYINCLKDKFDHFSKLAKRKIAYPRDTMFDIANVSIVDERQAREVFFIHVINAIKLTKDPRTGDNWFERYAGLDLRGGGFGDIKDKAIIFPTKNPGEGTIRFMSFNSTKKAPEGLHMFLFFADELSRADTKVTRKEAGALYDLGLDNTSSSFPNFVAKVIGWAYPNDSEYDLTHERYEMVIKQDLPHIFARRFKTWEYDTQKSKEMYAHLYKADPIKCERVFECKKPVGRENFYQPHVFKLDEAVNKNLQNKITYKYKIVNRKVTDRHTGEVIENKFTGIELLGIMGDKKERCFAYDAGITKDFFIIVGGHLETIDPTHLDLFIGEESEVIVTNKRPVIDIMIVIPPKPGFPVDYLGVGEIFTALIQHFPNIMSINSDRYQNEKLRQEFIDKNIQSETYHFSNKQQVRIYCIKRANVWINNLELCSDQNVVDLGNGTLTSATNIWLEEGKRLLMEGSAIKHPGDGSKDIQDAVAICVNDLMKLETMDINMNANSVEDLTDEKLHALVEKFMELKHELLAADTPKNLILMSIAESLRIKEKDAERLEKFVFNNYGY